MSLPLRAIDLCSQRCSGSICLNSAHLVLRDLLLSFRVSAPSYPMRPPSWDLSKVLRFLISGAFEPLRDAPLRALSKKVLFLLALATAKRVGSSRHFRVLFLLSVAMPVSPMFRNSCAHGIRGVSTSVALHRNWSVSAVLDAATWSSSSVFTSSYLRDLQYEFQGHRSLGPSVALTSSRFALGEEEALCRP